MSILTFPVCFLRNMTCLIKSKADKNNDTNMFNIDVSSQTVNTQTRNK